MLMTGKEEVDGNGVDNKKNQRKDIFSRYPLPAIIGTPEFDADDYVGLWLPDEEEEEELVLEEEEDLLEGGAGEQGEVGGMPPPPPPEPPAGYRRKPERVCHPLIAMLTA